MDQDRWKTGREWGVACVAVVALIVSILSYFNSRASVRVANSASDQAQQQFDASGPVLEITGLSISMWDAKARKWAGDIPRGHVLSYAELTAPMMPYVILTVVNTGRSSASIKEVALRTSSSEFTLTANLLCPTSKGLPKCQLPIELPPTRETTLYVAFDQFSQSSLTCNQFVQGNGLIFGVRDTSQRTVQKASGYSVAWASYCTTLPTTSPSG